MDTTYASMMDSTRVRELYEPVESVLCDQGGGKFGICEVVGGEGSGTLGHTHG